MPHARGILRWVSTPARARRPVQRCRPLRIPGRRGRVAVTASVMVVAIRDLRDMIADGQELTAEATIQAMSRYSTVPATDFA